MNNSANNSVEKLINHYAPRLKKYKESYKILDWESREAQTARFKVLFENVPLEGLSILDVGCGCGDLFELIREKVPGADYTGIDILPGMVEKAMHLHGNAKFLCGDLFSDPSICGRNYDVVYTSGIFNLNLGNNADFFDRAVVSFSRIAEKYMVITLLDEASPDRDEKYYYFKPEEAAEKAASSGWKVSVVKGYLENDFTLLCKRDID